MGRIFRTHDGFPLGFLLAIAALGGCGALGAGREPSVTGAKGRMPVSQLEPLVDSFAERQVTLIADVCEVIKRETTSPEIRRLANRVKLANATAVYDVVTQPDPLSRLANLYILVELEYLVWVKEGQAARMFEERAGTRLVSAVEEARLEMSVLADLAMKPDVRRRFDDLIREWRERNPDVEFVAGIRFGALLEAPGKSVLQSATSLFNVMGGTRESVDSARVLGDRAFFYSKRLLKLADWQAEAALETLITLPEVQALPVQGKNLIDHLIWRVVAVLLLLFALFLGSRFVVARWIRPGSGSGSRRPPTTWESRYGSPT